MIDSVEKLGYLPSIMVSGAPFPYGFENMAMYIQGSAGSGKSQVIKQMLYDIRQRGGRDRLVIYDRKPEYLPIFYKDGDVIICPADRRHTPWDMFAEIKGEQDIDGVIKSLFPDLPGTTSNDKFWNDSARGVFKGILIYLLNQPGEKPSNVELCKLLFTYSADPAKLWGLLKRDSAARMYAGVLSGAESKNPSNMPSSVIGTMKSYTDSFTKPEIAEKGWFSVKDWLRDPCTEGQALYLMNPSKYESNYRSYFTLILDMMLREIISIPNDINRRTWFIIDEFGSLFKLDSIIRLLAEGRSKGCCTVIGTQDMAQIKQQYDKETETLLNNCNSKVIARITSYEEAEYISKLIGEMEIERDPDSIGTRFDDKGGMSVSFDDKTNDGRRERRSVVLPAEIINLPSLTYYNKFCEFNWFKTKIDYYPWSKHELVPGFLERPREFFDTRRLL